MSVVVVLRGGRLQDLRQGRLGLGVSGGVPGDDAPVRPPGGRGETVVLVQGIYQTKKNQPADFHMAAQVYDPNGDGVIDQSELREIIKSCVAENGMEFDETQVIFGCGGDGG